jgi:hypothetical protein
MRTAAGGLEDPAAVYEVRVGSRTGLGARTTSHSYKQGTLVGSEQSVIVTETILIPDIAGMFTARLRAPREEFAKILPGYREFLLQLQPGPPQKEAPKSELSLPP